MLSRTIMSCTGKRGSRRFIVCLCSLSSDVCVFVYRRGVTEGVTLLLLALQTGLLDMAALQRCFLLFIILFIVLTSTLQSMSEITEPVVLGLGASRNRHVVSFTT